MKDYYKILGVEEEASENEIRARWIELTKHYHPDLGKTEEVDEKIREINEAYEILQNVATRYHYDFERDLKRSLFKKALRRQERRMNIRKATILSSSGILVFFLIVGFFLFRRVDDATPPRREAKTETVYKVDKVSEKGTALQTPPVKTDSKATEEVGVLEEIKKEAKPPESKKMATPQESKEEALLSPTLSRKKLAPQVAMKSEISTRREVSGEVMKEIPKQVAKEVPKELPTQVAKDVPIEPPKKVSKEFPEEVVNEVPKETPKEALKEVPQEVSTEVPKQVAKEAPKETQKEAPKEMLRVTLHPGEKLTVRTNEGRVASPLPPPLAKEEEVRQFFSSYIDRYHQKDIDGFLSLFSSKAIHNQKDGLKGIRNIYSKFFNQSQELRYDLEGMKIEIYQNSVEVKALFRVDQKLKKPREEKIWGGNIRWVLVKEDGNLKISSLDYQNDKSP